MTHVLGSTVEASFSEQLHPRAPKGSTGGGEFANGGGGQRRAPAHRRTIPRGQLGFDGQRGTGYGVKGGDPQVRQLQTDLNRLGLTDSHGKQPAVDGQLGPLTTQAIKAAQTRLGMKPTGIIAPAFVTRLKALHALPKPHTPPKKTVKAAADPKTPYGPKPQVEYADPGYQPDGKARYPLDSVDHCKAAWSYINQAGNAAKYTAEQLAKVKAKIKAAGKRYGVDFADAVKAAAGDLYGVELARPGPWSTKTGQKSFTTQDLKDAADFFAASGGQAVPVKLGHDDGRFDGEPSFGSVTNVRYAEDDRGPVLLGDIVDMPTWLAASAPKRWPNRSIEGWQNFTFDGREYSLILSGLAFLGVTPPAMRNIRSLTDLRTALAASSAQRVLASADAGSDVATPPQAPAPEAEEPIAEGTGMDPVKIREALGLSADASDEEVGSAFAAGFTGQAPAPPEPEPVQASLFEPAAPQAAPVQPKPVAAAGTIVLASSVWEATQKTIRSLTDHVEKTKRAERDEVISKAVTAGKFTPAQKPHFSRLWDADPDGTRVLIDTLTPNSALAVMASGYSDSGEDADFDREFGHLFAPTGKGA